MFNHKGKDITGQRFGRLTAIEPIGKTKAGNIIWRCKCDCGNEKNVSTKFLGRDTLSCGCLGRERRQAKLQTHGMSRTRLYNVHRTMVGRCTNPNAHEYENYGGRGIKVCNEWRDFEAFAKWALENGYAEKERGKCTLDRINPNGDYEPSNCRWVTMKTQERNKRNNHLITFRGETHCMSEWAEIAGLKYVTFTHRVKAGWSMERIMSTPPLY